MLSRLRNKESQSFHMLQQYSMAGAIATRIKGINTPQGKPRKVEAKPPFPPQGARYGSLRCLHSLGRVTTSWSLSPRFVWHERLLPSPHVACTRSGE